tara:strand:- start:528 stop:1148 length:621 start_codon:yes stop_codon:yes gene_type:complete
MPDKDSKEIDFDSLRFIRIFTPMHIPKELIEQVRDREYSVEDWYKYQEVICLRQTDAGPQLNPLSLLYVIADDMNRVVGMLWCEIDALSKALIIQIFSMDKSYWSRGKAVSLVASKAKEVAKECDLKRIVWQTNYPKHSERYGFKRSKTIQMEYHQEEENGEVDREYKTGGKCSIGDSAADGLPEPSTTESGAGCAASIPAVSAAV